MPESGGAWVATAPPPAVGCAPNGVGCAPNAVGCAPVDADAAEPLLTAWAQLMALGPPPLRAGDGDGAKNESEGAAAADAGESGSTTTAGGSQALVVANKDDAADDGDSDLPADVMQVVSDAQEDMMTAIQNLRKCVQAAYCTAQLFSAS